MSLYDKEFYAVILGALLHDIGKFFQRAQSNPTSQDHSHWGEEWFQNNLSEKLSTIFPEKEKNIIRSAIANHHGYEEYITLADAISAGMDRISLDLEEKGDPFSDRLISIFSKISISGKLSQEKYNRLAPLGKEELKETFPIEQKTCSQKDYADLLNSFENELKEADFKQFKIEELTNYIYFVLWKYCWCIPSATYRDEPDVPLFDHLKTTAAIAGCLYVYKKDNPRISMDIKAKTLCLVAGDISGIQSFIFDVLTQQGKVAKRLRARSLFIQLISEIASHKILHAFNLPICNLILSAGGNFYILIPNIKMSSNIINNFQKEFDEWTLKKLNAEVSVALAMRSISCQDLLNFSNILEEVKYELRLKKYTPFSAFLLNKEKWLSNEFVRPEVVEGDDKVCHGCHKFPIEEEISEEESYCQRCITDIRIGALIPKIKYIAFFNNKKSHNFEIFNYSFELCDDRNLQSVSKDKPYLLISLNDPNFKYPVIGFKYITNHIPTKFEIPDAEVEEGQPVTLNDIANKSNGDKLIGFVKADVDNMGLILKAGFKNKNFSISKFATFSRLLETFFGGYLQERMIKDFKEAYTVFSGGDDFFIIGPWDKMINFVRDIRNDFSKFCADNPELTFSAGIILVKPHEPISYCAEMVEENLKKSKRKEGKNGITLFNQTISWEDLVKILEEGKKIITWLKDEPPIITRGFAYNLKKYGEMAYKSKLYEPSGELQTEFLRFIPLLVYDIRRNLIKENQKEAFIWAEDLIPSAENPKGGENLRLLQIIMDYVLTFTRS